MMLVPKYFCSECGEEFETEMECINHNIIWKHQEFRVFETPFKMIVSAEEVNRYVGERLIKYPK